MITAVTQLSLRIHWATSPDSRVLDSTPTFLVSPAQAQVASPIPLQSCLSRLQVMPRSGSKEDMRVTRASSLLPRGLITAEADSEAGDVAEVGALDEASTT